MANSSFGSIAIAYSDALPPASLLMAKKSIATVTRVPAWILIWIFITFINIAFLFIKNNQQVISNWVAEDIKEISDTTKVFYKKWLAVVSHSHQAAEHHPLNSLFFLTYTSVNRSLCDFI